MTDKKLPCDVVQDLLPLYVDGVCSADSRQLVDAHLAECDDCRRVLADLQESETEAAFHADAKAVIRAHNKHQSKTALALGVLISVFLTGVMGVMLYVTLKGWSDWQTTITVGASLLFLAGLTAVPLLASSKRLTKAIVFSTLALVLVILCEEAFFGEESGLETLQIITATIFAISLFAFPVVVRQAHLPEPLCHHKLVITMLWDSIWFVLMMLFLAIDVPQEMGFVMVATLSLVAVAWLIALAARYLRVHWLAKGGIAVVLLALWTAFGMHFGWAMFDGVDSPLLVGGIGSAIGAIFVAIGAILGKKGRK
ncbi:MAG: zf-HC2 domain-containing protein [Peptococcaceae bacterium]|nr:zf-HC2 domain-containing protein [Peptococcaceae bacterium]